MALLLALLLRAHDGVAWQSGWTAVNHAFAGRDLNAVHFVDGRRGWAAGDGGLVIRTEDGGQTWTAQQTRTTATLYHVNFRNERVGWAVGERGTILRTTDGGETWLAVPAQLRSTLLSVKFANNDDGWIVGRGGVILRSGVRRPHLGAAREPPERASLRAPR